MIAKIAIKGLQTAVNQFIQLDPFTSKRVAELNGKTVAFVFKDIDITLYATMTKQGMVFTDEIEGEADTTLTGTPLALIKMGMASFRGGKLFSEGVEIKGDIELGQEIKGLVDSIDIDWEEHLSHIVGDVVAHKVGNVFRGMLGWGKEVNQSMQQNLTEYLQEEVRYVPCQEEVQDFMQDVDKLRQDVDRFQAKLQNAFTRIKS